MKIKYTKYFILMSESNFVYCVFEISGEGDSWTVFSLESIHKTKESAEYAAKKLLDINYFNKPRNEHYLTLKSITEKENPLDKYDEHIFYGIREEIPNDCNYGYCGGYLIEKVEVKKSDYT